MCLSVCIEELGDLGIYCVAVVCASLLCHTDTAVRLHGTLERLVSLEAYDCLLVLVQIAGAMGCDRGDHLCIHVQNAACFSLLLLQVKNLLPQILCVLSCAS